MPLASVPSTRCSEPSTAVVDIEKEMLYAPEPATPLKLPSRALPAE